MFENIIAQSAARQIQDDLLSVRLAPSMLFFGPPASGKGSAALELARVLSCENSPLDSHAGKEAAPWNCACHSCARHRFLMHGDLLMLGPRAFAPEIAASRAAFARDPSSQAARTLFIRSLRKLLARFSPVLLEDDPKLGKFSALLQSMEEGINEFDSHSDASNVPEKLIDSLLKDSLKLESEGISDLIPVSHIRKAAYWGRLAPSGRRKTLLIENADRMRDEARNSLLKLLEEPPETLNIVLSSQRREAILPTILSRVRPYRFLKRGEEHEREIIRRVFRDTVTPAENGAAGLVSAYLDSFLPQSADRLRLLAAFFVASLARAAANSRKKQGAADIPPELAALGSFCAAAAAPAGFERASSARDVNRILLAESGGFEAHSFSRFLKITLDLVSQALLRHAAPRPQDSNAASPRFIAYIDLWRRRVQEAESACGVWNQTPALALEALFCRLKEELENAE